MGVGEVIARAILVRALPHSWALPRPRGSRDQGATSLPPTLTSTHSRSAPSDHHKVVAQAHTAELAEVPRRLLPSNCRGAPRPEALLDASAQSSEQSPEFPCPSGAERRWDKGRSEGPAGGCRVAAAEAVMCATVSVGSVPADGAAESLRCL